MYNGFALKEVVPLRRSRPASSFWIRVGCFFEPATGINDRDFDLRRGKRLHRRPRNALRLYAYHEGESGTISIYSYPGEERLISANGTYPVELEALRKAIELEEGNERYQRVLACA